MTIRDGAASTRLEGAALVNSLKKTLGTAALAGALVPLAVAGMATDAEAGVEISRSSHVEGTVSPLVDTFLYEFEVFNDTPFFSFQGTNTIVDWELPLFSLNGIDVGSIQSPEFWTFEIIDIEGNIVINEAGDTSGVSQFYNTFGPYGEYAWNWTAAADPVFQADNDVYGPNPDQFENPNLILHWYTENFEGPANPIFEQTSLTGFSFEAADSATNAPYLARRPRKARRSAYRTTQPSPNRPPSACSRQVCSDCSGCGGGARPSSLA